MVSGFICYNRYLYYVLLRLRTGFCTTLKNFKFLSTNNHVFIFNSLFPRVNS